MGITSLLRGRSGIKWKMLPLIQTLFRLTGRDWNHFYAWMLDRQESNNNIRKVLQASKRVDGKDKGLYDMSRGDDHVWLLKGQGLKPHHMVLDFGCGFGRSAVPLLKYLESGKYVGTDLSAERIRIAREYVDVEGLADTKPQFYVSPTDNDVSYLPPGGFDYIFGRAVLCHMPLKDVEVCLRQLKKVLKTDGMIIIDYNEGPEVSVANVKDYSVPENMMRELVMRCGLKYDEISQWEKDILPQFSRRETRMMRLTHLT
jgi:SAM-dependent methyltransferase